jgi:putative sterol carrier protein
MARKFENIQQVVDSMQKSFRVEKAAGVDAQIQLNYTGDNGGNWWLKIKDQKLEVNDGEVPDPTLIMTVSADDWLDIVNGDANAMALLMKRKLKFSGSMPMAMKFAGLFGLA